ncbi:6148_t:CDS:2, partial [Funneliformis caledonium]
MDTFSDSSSYSESLSGSITNDDEQILFESNSDYSEESQSSEYNSQIDDNK